MYIESHIESPSFSRLFCQISMSEGSSFWAVRFVKRKFSMKVTKRAGWRNIWIRLLSCSPDREAKVTVFARFRKKQLCHILLAILSRHRQKFLSPGFTVIDWKQSLQPRAILLLPEISVILNKLHLAEARSNFYEDNLRSSQISTWDNRIDNRIDCGHRK